MKGKNFEFFLFFVSGLAKKSYVPGILNQSSGSFYIGNESIRSSELKRDFNTEERL